MWMQSQVFADAVGNVHIFVLPIFTVTMDSEMHQNLQKIDEPRRMNTFQISHYE